MIDFASATRLMDETVADVFDQDECLLRPRAKSDNVNAGRIDDPARATFEFMGSLEIGPEAVTRNSGLTIAPALDREAVTFEAVITANSSGFAHAPKRYDWIECKGKVWEIQDQAKDGSDRFVAYVNSAKDAS